MLVIHPRSQTRMELFNCPDCTAHDKPFVFVMNIIKKSRDKSYEKDVLFYVFMFSVVVFPAKVSHTFLFIIIYSTQTFYTFLGSCWMEIVVFSTQFSMR